MPDREKTGDSSAAELPVDTVYELKNTRLAPLWAAAPEGCTVPACVVHAPLLVMMLEDHPDGSAAGATPSKFSLKRMLAAAKVADTVVSAARLTTQVPVPEQPPPDQPVNMELASLIAVRVTAAFCKKLAEQVLPHEIPAGDEVTVPLPVPSLVTVRVLVTGGVKEILPVMVAPGAEIPVRLKLMAAPL